MNDIADIMPPDAMPMMLLEAERELARRHARSSALPASYFDEGPWEILLGLFVAFAKDRSLSVTDATHGTTVSSTTALRCISLLEKDGLVYRLEDKRDKRRTNLALSASGLRKCALALRAMSEAEKKFRKAALSA